MPAEATSLSSGEILVIIPAYNPGEILKNLCRELHAEGYGLMVVDDGSTIRSCLPGSTDLGVGLIRHAVNLGQGAALETGIRYGMENGWQYFATMDADGQHSVSSLGDLRTVLQKDSPDIVFGSRFLDRRHVQAIPVMKRVTLKLAAVFDGLLTGTWLTDSHNGLRLFNRKVAGAIHFKENRMAHATEILWLARQERWRVRECPVLVTYNNESQHPLRSIEIAIDIFLRKIIS